MREQVLHLVREYTSTLQVNVLGIIRRKGDRDEFHRSLFRRATALVVVAPAAGRRHVVPNVPAALRQRRDVIAGQIPGRELHRTVETKIRITLEQRSIVERRDVLITNKRETLTRAFGRDDRIDCDVAATAGQRAETAQSNNFDGAGR